ncbi:hypothetical protein SKAU_G00395220 [Synaphobranchus kaupii]|uniref:Uncharacterized protein n=1 Tax=Synaphobranchus kaupii TaxID=118154 RepID=A0A9Q1IE06_SYNKA|nr:hypothetical protein SKAU_G00395220 [Synaphobranchus kaupii]
MPQVSEETNGSDGDVASTRTYPSGAEKRKLKKVKRSQSKDGLPLCIGIKTKREVRVLVTVGTCQTRFMPLWSMPFGKVTSNSQATSCLQY